MSISQWRISFLWSEWDEARFGPITAYKYMIHTDMQTIIGMVLANETICTVNINTQKLKRCTLKIAAVNVAGVGEYSPEIETVVPLSRASFHRKKSKKIAQFSEKQTKEESQFKGKQFFAKLYEQLHLCF